MQEKNDDGKKENILEEERTKLKMLENMVRVIYNQKVKIDKKNGTMEVDLTTSGMRDLVAVEESIMKLKRKINGFLEW